MVRLEKERRGGRAGVAASFMIEDEGRGGGQPWEVMVEEKGQPWENFVEIRSPPGEQGNTF
uniref:Uncharacterized protein LOC104243207 n=1 Tax=Nicotiana sylvestris TaxID=4096 RepID=A0A1U7XXF6_NICSY|nr:PREDICTED: uncharacterized protein LOC104243207 [Nicotiana sylvestris]